MALAAFFLVYKPRDWELGPDLESFLPPDGPRGPSDGPSIKRVMADGLLWASEANASVLVRKSKYFQAGYWLLGIGLLVSFVLAIVGPR